MQLTTIRRYEAKSLDLKLLLSVAERRWLHERELLSYALHNGHTIAELEVGCTVICPDANAMLDVEYEIESRLNTLKNLLPQEPAAPAQEDLLLEAGIPPHTHPQYFEKTAWQWGLLLFLTLGLALAAAGDTIYIIGLEKKVAELASQK